jgi:hypothetical protein
VEQAAKIAVGTGQALVQTFEFKPSRSDELWAAAPRGPSYFNRFRRKRGQRDLVEMHDQEAADAMEQVYRAAIPQRPRRSSQQNALRLIQAAISRFPNRQ